MSPKPVIFLSAVPRELNSARQRCHGSIRRGVLIALAVVFVGALVTVLFAAMFAKKSGDRSTKGESPMANATPRQYRVEYDPPVTPEAVPHADPPAIPAATPPPAAGTPKPVDPLAANDAALAALDVGELAFNTPQQMKTGETRVLQLVLAVGMESAQVKALVVEPGVVQGAPVRVAPTMEARLTGDDVFTVTAITPEEQAISRNEPTEWRWNLVSHRSGKHRLHLTVTAVLKTDTGEKRRTLKTFDREIEVLVAPAKITTGQIAGLAFAGLLLVVAIVGFVLLRRRKRGTGVSLTPRPADAADVFISYARSDTARVAPLVAALEKAGVKAWMDVHGIDGATQWAAEIAEAMRHAHAVVLMGSPAAYASHYVQREIALAAEEGKPIVPVELEPAEIPAALKLNLAGVQRIAANGVPPEAVGEALLKALARLGRQAGRKG